MRGASGYISQLEDLYTWFAQQKHTAWTLMQGFQDGVQQKGVIYKNADAEMAQEDSWALLKSMIEINSVPGARFTVFVPSNEHGNRGYTVKLQLGEAANPYQIAGIGGAPMAGMLTKTDMAAEIAKERRIWEMERKLEDMEAARLSGIGDVIKDKILETNFEPVVAGIMGMLNTIVENMLPKKAPMQVSLQGSTMDRPPATEAEGGEQPSGYEYDGDKLVTYLDRMRPHFASDEDFYAFMDKISAKFSENPTLYKSLVG